MNLFNEIKDKIKVAVAPLIAAEAQTPGWFDAVTVELPRDPSHGDVATNAAMVLTKKAGFPPRQLAEKIVENLKSVKEISSAEIAGPGFINLHFAPDFWQSHIAVILEHGRGYGNSEIGKGKKINLEYVSANPTGPVHIGHARGAMVGDALAILLMKAGFNVTKEYYINDAGAQVETLARSSYLRYREACGEAIEIPAGMYPGDYLKAVGESLRATYGDTLLSMPEDKWLELVQPFAVDSMLALIRDDLLQVGIQHDVFFSEKTLHQNGLIEKTVKELEAKGLIYRGILEPPKGKTPDDWEPREQTLMRTTQFGDDCDRPLQKSDGSWTYFAADVAYTKNKLERGFDALVMVLGADHGGYVKRMEAVTSALSDGKVPITLLLSQLVKFMENGQPMKMSKRKGTFATLREVVDEVGPDVVRFIMLTRAPSQMLDFDLAKVTEQSKDNPVFYVQYAHARCRSLVRMAREEMPEALPRAKNLDAALLSALSHPAELALIRLLATWPKLVESAALSYEPYRVAYYLQEVAAAFHSFWNLGNDEIGLRFIVKNDIDKTAARLCLAEAVATVIASGLQVLGVEPVESM